MPSPAFGRAWGFTVPVRLSKTPTRLPRMSSLPTMPDTLLLMRMPAPNWLALSNWLPAMTLPAPTTVPPIVFPTASIIATPSPRLPSPVRPAAGGADVVRGQDVARRSRAGDPDAVETAGRALAVASDRVPVERVVRRGGDEDAVELVGVDRVVREVVGAGGDVDPVVAVLADGVELRGCYRQHRCRPRRGHSRPPDYW